MDFVDVSAASRGFVFGGGAVAAALVGTAVGGGSVVVTFGKDGTLSLVTTFHGDDVLESSPDFSQAAFTGGVSDALAACSACICCCLLRSFCEILVGCCDLAAEASLAFCAAKPAERAEVPGDASFMMSRRSSFAVDKAEEAQGFPNFLAALVGPKGPVIPKVLCGSCP